MHGRRPQTGRVRAQTKKNRPRMAGTCHFVRPRTNSYTIRRDRISSMSSRRIMRRMQLPRSLTNVPPLTSFYALPHRNMIAGHAQSGEGFVGGQADGTCTDHAKNKKVSARNRHRTDENRSRGMKSREPTAQCDYTTSQRKNKALFAVHTCSDRKEM